MKFQRIEAFVAAVATVGFVAGFPKYETSEKGYHLVEGNDTAIKGTNRQEEQIGDQMQEDAQNRPPRFGFTTYSHDVQVKLSISKNKF